jgi:hypothetical protein
MAGLAFGSAPLASDKGSSGKQTAEAGKQKVGGPDFRCWRKTDRRESRVSTAESDPMLPSTTRNKAVSTGQA